MMDISVIIIGFNDRNNLNDCLKSLYNNHHCLRFGIVYIDNASIDGSMEVIRKNYPQVKVIQNPKNSGVAAARNQGIKAVIGKYVLFLDSDTEVQNSALKKLYEYMETNKDTAIVGPKLINSEGSAQYSCRKFPTFLTFIARGLGFKKNSIFQRKYLMLDFPHAETCDVDWVIGACQIIRREAIEDVGMLDEKYFFGYEDVDFCYRVKKKGWKVAYVPDAVVTHHYQRRSARGGIFNPLKWSHAKSAIRFLVKKSVA